MEDSQSRRTLKPSLLQTCAAEAVGTFILVFIGVGAVHSAVITGAMVGIWQVAVVWGIGIALAIYATGSISGAHLNPAVTISMATFRRFPWRNVGPYIAFQLLGAILAAAALYGLFHEPLASFEATKGIVRGAPGSEVSAMVYGEYFPNPGMLATTPSLWGVSIVTAMAAEAIGTALLLFVILAVTDEENVGRPHRSLAPWCIGLTVTVLIELLAPLSQAGFNPARDFGPRLFAYAAGWNSIAIPGPHGGFFTVYILSPIVGGLIGSGIYQGIMRPLMRSSIQTDERHVEVPLPLGTSEIMTKKPLLILVGGFLGAGKTTLLAAAAQALKTDHRAVALITNDQAADLVDTGLLRNADLDVSEIAGGCFCCRFDQLIETMNRLVKACSPEIMLGEPVGSCTDLSATVVQPLKDLYRSEFHLAPLSVLVDSRRIKEVADPLRQRPMHQSARYILRKQLDEADIIVVNKKDLLSPEEQNKLVIDTARLFPGKAIHFMSAQSGEGVSEWLELVLNGTDPGRLIVDVDYDIYAAGEAVLGWLNASATVHTKTATDWAKVGTQVIGKIQSAMNEREAPIAHVKLALTAGSEQIAVNVTSNDESPSVRGKIGTGVRVANLIVNARAEVSPEEMQLVVSEVLGSLGNDVEVTIDTLQSLSPGRPTPTHRYTTVI